MIFFWPPTIVSTNCAPERERVNALLPSWRGVLKFFSNRKTFRKPKTKKKQEKKENLGRECSITIYIPTCNQQRPLVYIFLFLFSSLPFFDVWTVWRVVREGNHDYKMMTLGCPLFGNKERIFFSLLFLDGKKKKNNRTSTSCCCVFFFKAQTNYMEMCTHILKLQANISLFIWWGAKDTRRMLRRLCVKQRHFLWFYFSPCKNLKKN